MKNGPKSIGGAPKVAYVAMGNGPFPFTLDYFRQKLDGSGYVADGTYPVFFVRKK